ncbi:hypothetical protein LAZ67_9000053 [Cordylochernes scorpioides]|uniref:guanylate cyclase n=1 Tax=Cordylochernes scorpioides TaxID=51811 RepID=A0ABY6KVT8_9ARAC|nr:hypothetical protein LAZ67_9000053 [Cordylochernes scorpioides]
MILMVVSSVFSLLQHFKWRRFVLVVENSSPYLTMARSLELQLPQNMSLVATKQFENFYYCCENKDSCCFNSFVKIIEATYFQTRVYVFLGSPSELINMNLVLQMKGLLEHGEYVVIYVDLELFLEEQADKYFWYPNLKPEEKPTAEDAARSLLVIVPSPPHHRDYPEFESRIRHFNSIPPFGFRQTIGQTTGQPINTKIPLSAAYLYDAVMLYARALDAQLRLGLDIRNGTDTIRRIIEMKKYESVTGALMSIEENGDVAGNYTVLAGHTRRGPTKDKLVMMPVGRFLHDDSLALPVFRQTHAIDWVAGRLPLDEPPCGFDGSKCHIPPDRNREIVAVVLGTALIIVALLAAILYRNWRYEQEISGLLWKIELNHLDLGYYNANPFEECRASLVTMETKPDRMYTQTAIYRGAAVAIKKILFSLGDVSRLTKKEMKSMKELRHDNVNKFIGACVEPHCLYVVTEYCSKGSLQDILENEDFKLDQLFIASLVFDLIKGMMYLHGSELKVHGNLKSSNCVISARWGLQVTDYGLHQLRSAQTLSEEEYYRGQLWTAPELLQSPCGPPTQKGDVYAFGIILHEILARKGPFGNTGLSPKEIVGRVRAGARSGVVFRPSFAGIDCQDYVVLTVKDCWSQRPEVRPELRAIRHRLQRMRQGL